MKKSRTKNNPDPKHTASKIFLKSKNRNDFFSNTRENISPFFGPAKESMDVSLSNRQFIKTAVNSGKVPSLQLQRANPQGNGPATAPPIRPEFSHSGYDEEYNELQNPWSSEMESELSRLTRYAMGYADHGRSELRNPFFEDERAQFNQGITDFVNRFLSTATAPDRNRMVQLLRAYLNGYVQTMPSRNDIANYIERQHGGYDAMATLLAQHSGIQSADQWNLSNSTELMQLLHDMGYWQDLDRRVVETAEREYLSWTDVNDTQGRQRSESHAGEQATNVSRFEEYWRAAGRNQTSAHTSAVGSFNDNAAFPWSAAFVSFVMMQAGAGDTFNYSTAHSNYAVAARNNQQNNASAVTHPSRLLNADTEPVHVGGLIHRRRSSGTAGVTYANLAAGNQTHADIVVGIRIFNANGDRVPGRYMDIINNTDAAILATYQIFAVTIGGNTIDQELVQNNSVRSIIDRYRSGEVANKDNETVGRRFWKLNTDLTIDNSAIPANIRVYGIQRMENPPRSDETRI